MGYENIKEEILLQSSRLMSGEVMAQSFIEKRLSGIETDPYWLVIEYFHRSLHTSPNAGITIYFEAIENLIYAAEYYMKEWYEYAAYMLNKSKQGIDKFQTYLNWDRQFVMDKLISAHHGAVHVYNQVKRKAQEDGLLTE